MSRLPPGAVAALKLLLGLFVLLLAAGRILQPISDPDFFWHLRTGAWIVEHRALPAEFLFTFTAPAVPSAMQRFSMTSYWAAQIVIAIFFAAGGWKGISLLRAALTALFLGALALRRRGDDLILLGLLALAAVVMRLYYFERPQVISFILFALLVDQLERLRRDPAGEVAPLRRAIPLPLIMVVWANCHGGYVIGQGAIVLCLAAEGVRQLHPALGPLPRRRYRLLALAGGAGLLASLANPNTYHGLTLALLPSWATSLNREYLSTIALFRETGDVAIAAYWFLLGLAVLGTLLPPARPDPTRIALLAFTGAVSFAQVRHVAFLVVVALPIALEALSRERFRSAGRVLVLAPALLAGTLVLRHDAASLRERPPSFGVSSPLFPTDAADFLEQAGIRGRMYNFYGWGGYLLWRLAPAEVFIDGRTSDRALFEQYRSIESGAPSWKALLASRGIRFTITPIFNHATGAALPLLLDRLVADPDWAPVFIGRNSTVFVERSAPESRGVLERFAIPRERVLPALLERCESLVREQPGNPAPLIARGDVLTYLGRLAEARASFGRAAALVPAHPELRARLEWLRRRGIVGSSSP